MLQNSVRKILSVVHYAQCAWNPTELAQQCLGIVVAIALGVASAAAGPFTDLVVFGDSLSDVGNVRHASFGTYPGPYYSSGRFSNGPVYVEELAVGLGLPTTTPSTAGGSNFAYGGAKTSGTGGFLGLFIDDIDEQVDQFLATRKVDPSALFVVFAGSNDIVGGQTNVGASVEQLAVDISRLIDAGATQFLSLNLPPLGDTPSYNGNPNLRATYNTRSQEFNVSLAAALDGLEASHPAVTIHRFDVAALFSQALANPESFGMSNVTDPAAPGLEPGALSYDTKQIAPDANQYMFWDELHPTAAVHAILAQRVLALFALPVDFDNSGTVDAADYVVWRNGLGTAYSPEDYDLWRAHFGETTVANALAEVGMDSPIPEPASFWILTFAIAAYQLLDRVGSARRRAV